MPKRYVPIKFFSKILRNIEEEMGITKEIDACCAICNRQKSDYYVFKKNRKLMLIFKVKIRKIKVTQNDKWIKKIKCFDYINLCDGCLLEYFYKYKI